MTYAWFNLTSNHARPPSPPPPIALLFPTPGINAERNNIPHPDLIKQVFGVHPFESKIDFCTIVKQNVFRAFINVF